MEDQNNVQELTRPETPAVDVVLTEEMRVLFLLKGSHICPDVKTGLEWITRGCATPAHALIGKHVLHVHRGRCIGALS